jgi:hypothetical protein
MSLARKSRAPLALAALASLLALSACGSGSPAAHARARTAAATTADAGGATATDGTPEGAGQDGLSAGPPALLPAVRPTGVAVSVTVGAARGAANAATPVPADFLGLSFELRDLPQIARYAARGNLITLLRSLGPGVLRFGGVSADEHTTWIGPRASAPRDAGAHAPRGARTVIDPAELAGIAALARASGWRVLLTVDLGRYDPGAAGREAAAARAALGPALLAIAIGNEPDRYVRKGLRAPGWSFDAYRAQAAAYRAAIAAAAPGVAVAGPDPSSGLPGLAWLRATARALHPQLLTDHYYPLSSCGYTPTVSELLSPGVRAKDAAILAQLHAIARDAATPLRIDELGSVSCEGFPDVSDTLASALWALDYTAHAAATDFAGVNFHDLLVKPGAYSPLVATSPAALARGSLRAQPAWYALLAARALAGTQPLPTSVAAASLGELDASAFRATDGRLLLLLVDYDTPGSSPLDVRLRVPRPPSDPRRASAYTSGSILRLAGPSPAATAGVTLAGRAVAADGTWRAPSALPAVYVRRGALSLQLAPSSAALVTLYP